MPLGQNYYIPSSLSRAILSQRVSSPIVRGREYVRSHLHRRKLNFRGEESPQRDLQKSGLVFLDPRHTIVCVAETGSSPVGAGGRRP